MNHLCGLNIFESELINKYWEVALTEEELNALEAFENLYVSYRPLSEEGLREPEFAGLDDVLNSDGWRELDRFTLFRFLCADRLGNRKFQPVKSMDRLQECLRYRQEMKADAILKWWILRIEEQQEKRSSLYASSAIASGTLSECGQNVEEFHMTPSHKILHPGFSSMGLAKYERLRVRRFTGQCHEGQPVLFERLGDFLGSGNCSQFSEKEWLNFYTWDLERHFVEMRVAAKESKKPIQKYIFCGDGQGIVTAIVNRSIWKVLPLLKAYKSAEEFYPEIADRIILFNVPKVATFFYRVVRAFLDPVTAAKISLYSTADYEEVFSKVMPLEAIPVEYGGTSKVDYPLTATS